MVHLMYHIQKPAKHLDGVFWQEQLTATVSFDFVLYMPHEHTFTFNIF